ncbi:MAG TPA: MATE family efflux transporter [Acidimicrobiia bacterium]|nr:MATE family efflux transporter [Acidimicrobiia bacterium]
MGLTLRALRRSPFDREILRLALPALGALAADPLVSLVDTAYVGRLGTEALAALAVAAAVFAVAFSVFNFLQYGTTPLVAREIGAGDPTGAGRIAVAAAGAAVVLGVAAMAVLTAFPATLLGALGAGDELLGPGSEYLRIRALALPAVMLVIVGHGVYRGAQDTRTPLLIALALNGVNLVLDPILIFGFDMGLRGAAWASVVAQWSGAIGFFVVFRRQRRALQVEPARPSWREIDRLGRAGGALVLRTASLLVAFTATTAVAARLGNVPVAAHQVAMQLFIFLSLVLDAVAIAAQAMLGLAVGRNDPAATRWRAERLVGIGTLAGVGLAVSLVLVLPWLPGLFTTDPAVRDAIRSIYPQLCLIQVIGGAVFAWDGIVIGVTDFRWALYATAFPAAIVTGLLVGVAFTGLPLAAVWWAIVAMLALRAAMLSWWHRHRLTKRR